MKTNTSVDNLLPTISARDLALVVLKRKWSILVIVVTAMLGAVVWLWGVRDDMYKSYAKVLVKIGREQAAPPTVMGATPSVIGYRSQEVNSEIDIFQNIESIGRVVDRLHLDQPVQEPVPERFFPRLKFEMKQIAKKARAWQEDVFVDLGLRERLSPREKAIDALAKGLSVKAQKDSNVFVAELQLPKRRGAAPVLNALLDDYLESRQKTYQTGDLQFFRGEVARASADLRQSEQDLQRFENTWDISAIDKQETVLLDHIAQARLAWVNAEVVRQEAAARVRRLDAELQKREPEFSGVSEFGTVGYEQDLANQLAELQREREKLRLTELDTGDRIQNNRAQFKVVSQMLAANLRTALAEKAEEARLRRETFDTLRSQLTELHDKQADWLALKRKPRDADSTYVAFRKKLEEASANDAMERQRLGNVVVIERATDPLAPSGMRKTTLLSLCALAALVLSLTWVTVAEFFDHRIYTRDDLEQYVSAPVFAVVPWDKGLRKLGPEA